MRKKTENLWLHVAISITSTQTCFHSTDVSFRTTLCNIYTWKQLLSWGEIRPKDINTAVHSQHGRPRHHNKQAGIVVRF